MSNDAGAGRFLATLDGKAFIVAVLIVGAFELMTKRWFWVLVFFTAGLASCFAMLASIIHFQILGALGFFILMAVCWGFAGGIAGAEN